MQSFLFSILNSSNKISNNNIASVFLDVGRRNFYIDI